MRKYLYTITTPTRQGSLWFKFAELGLDKAKMFVTEERFPDIYSTTGFINLGDEKHYHENALILANKLLEGFGTDARIYFVPYNEKPFICQRDASGEVKLIVVGYFDTARTVFQRVNWDDDVVYTGLLEEVEPEKWDIIEE